MPSLRSEVHPERRPWQSPHVTCRYDGRQRLISNHSQYRCRSQTLQMWLQQLFNGNRMPSTHLKDCKITFGRKCSNSKLKHHSLYCFAFAKKLAKHIILSRRLPQTRLSRRIKWFIRERNLFRFVPYVLWKWCNFVFHGSYFLIPHPKPGANVLWLATKSSKLETFFWILKISPSSVRSVVLSSRATLI